MYSVIRNVSLGMIVGLGLVACTDEDKTTMSAPAESAPAATATATPASGGDDIFSSMKIEKAEGVIYQDEMYANWPYN
jgi:hypothetical protein